MTNLTPAPAFDFAAAVARARAAYPVQTACVVFIDKTAPDAATQLRRFIERTSPAFRNTLLGKYRAPASYAAQKISDNGSFAETDPVTGYGVLALGHRDAGYVNGVSADQMRHHVFMHELGHIVVPNGMYRDIEGLRLWCTRSDYWSSIAQTHEWETAADAFSFLHNLKAGTLTPAEIDALTLHDAAHMFRYPQEASALEHMTMPGSDAIITLATNSDITSLTPENIVAIAQKHARLFSYRPWQAGEIYEDIATLHNTWALSLRRSFQACAAIKPRSTTQPVLERLHRATQDKRIDIPLIGRAALRRTA